MFARKIIFLNSNVEDTTFFLELFKEKNWDVVVLHDSFEALQTIKKESDRAWVVLMSTYAKPLKAAQFKSYMMDMKLDVRIIEIAESTTEREILYDMVQISGPFGEVDKQSILEEVTTPPLKIAVDEELYALNYLRDLSSNSEEFIYKMLATFITSVAEKMEEIENLLQNRDEEYIGRIKEIAHSIKPSFEMLENQKGKNLCHAILHQLPPDEIPKATENLREEYTKIVYLLKRDHAKLAEV